MATFQLHERQHPFSLASNIFTPVELSILRRASELLARPLQRQAFQGPEQVREYLRCKLAGLEFEVFGALFLDSQVQLIADEVMFRGSICSTSVHPREVVKQAFRYNARHVILYHNHPSLSAEPSQADQVMTERLKQALDLVDVIVKDHFVVAGDGNLCSFSERGLL